MKKKLALAAVALIATVSAIGAGVPKVAHAGATVPPVQQCSWEYGTPRSFYNVASDLLWVELDDEWCNSSNNEYRYELSVWSPFPNSYTVRTQETIDIWRCGTFIGNATVTFTNFQAGETIVTPYTGNYGSCGPTASDGPDGSHINQYETNTYQVYAVTPCVVIGAGKCNGP